MVQSRTSSAITTAGVDAGVRCNVQIPPPVARRAIRSLVDLTTVAVGVTGVAHVICRSEVLRR